MSAGVEDHHKRKKNQDKTECTIEKSFLLKDGAGGKKQMEKINKRNSCSPSSREEYHQCQNLFLLTVNPKLPKRNAKECYLLAEK